MEGKRLLLLKVVGKPELKAFCLPELNVLIIIKKKVIISTKILFPPFCSFAIIFVDIITFLSLLIHGVGENKSFIVVIISIILISYNFK